MATILPDMRDNFSMSWHKGTITKALWHLHNLRWDGTSIGIASVFFISKPYVVILMEVNETLPISTYNIGSVRHLQTLRLYIFFSMLILTEYEIYHAHKC